MNITKILLGVLLFAFTAKAVKDKTIDLHDTRIDLPWSEFKGILDKVSEPVNKPLPDTLLPTAEYLISSATINGTVINLKAARFTVKTTVVIPYSANLKNNGWVTIPIGISKSSNSDKGVLEKAELNGTNIPINNRDDNLEVLFSKAGSHTLILTYYCPVINEEGNYKIAFTVPRAASALLNFNIPQMRADLWINGTKRIVQISNESTRFNSVVSLEDELFLRFSQIGESFAGEENGNQIIPKSFATSGLLVNIKENRINYQYRVDYQIWHQKKKSFSIKIPDSLQIENVQGTGISEWKIEKSNLGSILKVFTTFAPERNYTLNIEFNQKLKTAESKVGLPVLTILDVNRATGYLSVNASEAIEVFAEDKRENLTDADPEELPEWLQLQKDILMHFKYTRTPYSLYLQIKRHKDVPVLVAIADEALFNGIMTYDGYLLVKYRYFIRNNHKQYLKVLMSTGWVLWSALIDGNAVMPASSENGNEILIPLKKLSKTDEGAGFVLELVYWNQCKKLGLGGKLTLETPVIDINCQKIFGEIYLPQRFAYSDFKGSIQKVESYVNKYINYSQKAEASVQTRQFLNRIKGNVMSLPVEIEIPAHGFPLRFEKNLTIAGEKSEVIFKYNKKLMWLRNFAFLLLWLFFFTIMFFTSLSIAKNRTFPGTLLKSAGALAAILITYRMAAHFNIDSPSFFGVLFSSILFAALSYISRNRRTVAK